VLNTWLTLQHWRPDVVISAGTAGGFVAEGGRLGDVYLSSGDFVFHDRRVAIPGFDEAAHGRYPSADVADLATALGAKLGVVSTSNSLDRPDLDIEIMASHGAAVKEMEAAAVAWVCWLAGTPMFAVKSITDLVDSPTDVVEEFTANLGRATEKLAVAVNDLVPLLPEAALFDN
jgi:nucleoside phosphorylase